MQFMSQALGFSDCVLLAVAPLGIVTLIVSAIRVGGPTWLKAIIGRARENLSVAELELMSSTSEEACELWNGRNIIRCQGSADIWQFICLIQPIPHGTASESGSIVDFRTLDQVMDVTGDGDGLMRRTCKPLLLSDRKKHKHCGAKQRSSYKWSRLCIQNDSNSSLSTIEYQVQVQLPKSNTLRSR
jgi:hypothetical protein